MGTLISMVNQYAIMTPTPPRGLEFKVPEVEITKAYTRHDANATKQWSVGKALVMQPRQGLAAYKMPREKEKQTQTFCLRGRVRDPRTGSGRQNIMTSSERLTAASAVHLAEKLKHFRSETKMSEKE
jgi:hypothetical protein